MDVDFGFDFINLAAMTLAASGILNRSVVALNGSRIPAQDPRSLSAFLRIHYCDAYPRSRHHIVDAFCIVDLLAFVMSIA